MKSVNFDLNLTINDIINQLVENYKNKDEIVGIYKVCYFEDDKNIIEINLVFENTKDLPISSENYFKIFLNDIDLSIDIKGRHIEFFNPNSYTSSTEILTSYKDILCGEILYEEDGVLTKFKEHTLKMKENGIYPFGMLDMKYDNLIEFKPYKLERKKENHE